MANAGHRRPPAAAIVVVALAVAAGIGWYWWSQQQGAGRGSVALSGTIEADEYQVASALAGRIETVTVREGDTVKIGEVVARLDDRALKLQLEQAIAGVTAAKAQVDDAKDNGTDAEVDAAKARLVQARAAVKLARVQLGYATVKAPHGGVVVAVPASAGENAGPGKSMATLADPDSLFVRGYVPEPDMADVALGQTVIVRADGTDYDGTVTFIASSAEFTPNTVETKEQRGNLVYEIRVSVSDPGDALKPGLPVDLVIKPAAK